MKLRASLSTKILLLAVGNLVLLVAAFGVLARSYYNIEFRSLLFAPARDRVLQMARELAIELDNTPVREQTALMGRYAAAYGVDFYLFDNRGPQLAGKPVTLPAPVLEELMRGGSGRGPEGGRRGPPDGKRPPPPRRGPPPRSGRLPIDEPPPDGDDQPPPEQRQRREGRLPTPGGMFQVSADDLHWAGVRMPVPDEDGERPVRGTLVLAARSFYGTPLFFDFKPWLLAFAGAVGIFALCWVPFIRGLTRSISGITAATERIAQGDFQEHIAEARQDELGKLGFAINRMAGRLAGFVNGQKRFLGDIAHELSAPIARLQFSLGILEQKVEEEHLASLADVQEEVRQMSDLVAELLSFSKAGMEAVQRPVRPVDATEAVRRAVEREAGGRSVRIEAEGPIFALADEALLIRAVSNVVRNALRYAGEAGSIVVRLERAAGEVLILVQDWGPGLDAADLDRIFDPFYRPEASRNRETGGTGLGLAIVQSCVATCQGTVKCRNRVPSGLEVEIRLKAAG